MLFSQPVLPDRGTRLEHLRTAGKLDQSRIANLVLALLVHLRMHHRRGVVSKSTSKRLLWPSIAGGIVSHTLKAPATRIPRAFHQAVGGGHDQAGAGWMVIRRLPRGHNDTPFGRPGVGRPKGVFGVF
jgi:hypothetical protein